MPKKTVFLSGFVRTKRTRKRFFSCVLSHVLFQLRFGCGPIRADTASYGFLPCMNAHAMQLQITLHLWFVRAKATFKSFYSSFSDECVRDWRWVRFGFSWLDLQDRKIKLILSFIIKKVHRKFFLLQRTSRKGKKSELKIRKITELSSLPHRRWIWRTHRLPAWRNQPPSQYLQSIYNLVDVRKGIWPQKNAQNTPKVKPHICCCGSLTSS